MHLEPRYVAKRNYVAPLFHFVSSFPCCQYNFRAREIVTSRKDEIRYRNALGQEAATTVNCDQLNNTVPVHCGWCTVSALCTSWLPSRSCPQALPLILPYASLFRHRQAGFVARNDKSVLFDERTPPPSLSRQVYYNVLYICVTA